MNVHSASRTEISRTSPPARASGERFREILRATAHEIVRDGQRVDNIVSATRRGRMLGQNDLLEIQVTVYRYVQNVELASRVVDRLTSTVRQILQHQ